MRFKMFELRKNNLICISIFVLLLKAVCIFAAVGDIVTVFLENGTEVRGLEQHTIYENRVYSAFKGIPFAEPPIEVLRFKAPVAKQLPSKIDAFHLGNMCVQSGGEGSEDCLFLNIYSPDITAKSKLPVMFYIHGGGFYEGSGNDDILGPDFLIEEGIVLITFNYRLGVFGFLSLSTPEHSGNMGLKDQQLALRFVHEHIGKFGGDHDQITVFGHSAGAASTHLHVLMDSSAGLFQRAIAMSGSAGNAFAVQPKSDHILQMFELAQKYDPSVTTFVELKKWVISAPASIITDNIYTGLHLETVESSLNLLWAPISENPDALQPILLQDQPLTASDTLRGIDVMFGFTSAEWITFLGQRIADPKAFQRIDEKFDIVLPYLDFVKLKQSKHYSAMMNEIRLFYFGNATINAKTIPEIINVMADSVFGHGICESVKKHALTSKGNTFYYRFSANTTLNLMKTTFNALSLVGAAHGDELCYIFRCNVIPNLYDLPFNSTERTIQRQMLKVWANFAKHGNPSFDGIQTKILQVDANELHMLEIGNDGLTVGPNPNQKRYSFWNSLREKYRQIFAEEV